MALYAHSIWDLANVKAWLDIDVGNDDHNNLLYELMNTLTDWIEDYIGRRVVVRTAAMVEYHNGDGTTYLQVDSPPINTLTEIYIEDYVTLDSTDCADTDKVRYDPDTGEITLIQHLFLKYYPRNVKITYKGGWASASVPMKIKQAFVHEMKRLWRYKQLSLEDVAQKSNRLTGETVQFTPHYLRKGLSEEAKAMLEKYRIRRYE